MKTSKKLLSLFLAAVMVITTCSVGFSAFAAEGNKSIWNTESKADDAFDTLDGLANDLLPSLLLGIEAIGNPIYEKKAKELFNTTPDKLTEEQKTKIAEDTTLPDVLMVLQPTLFELLAGSSQQDFVDKYYPGFDASSFDALNDDSAAASFYTLVSLCEEFSKDRLNNGKTNPLTSDEKKQLGEWFDALKSVSDAVTGADALILSYAEKVSNYETASLEVLKATDFNVTPEDQEKIEASYSSFNEKARAYHVPEDALDVGSLAEIIYYFYGAGATFLRGYYYHYLISLTGKEVNFVGRAEILNGSPLDYNITEDITPSNAGDLFLEGTYKAMGFQTLREFLIFMSKSMNPDGKEPTEEELEALEAQVRMLISAPAQKFYLESVLPTYFHDALAGIMIEAGKIENPSELDDLVADYMPEGWQTEECVISTEEIGLLVSAFSTLFTTTDDSLTASNAQKYFSGETVDAQLASNKFKLTLSSVLQGTAVADYFKEAMNLADTSNNSTTFIKFRNNFTDVLIPSFGSSKILITVDGSAPNADMSNLKKNEDGVPLYNHEDYPPTIGNIDGLDDEGDFEKSINGYFARAEEYAYNKIVTDAIGITDFTVDSYSNVPFVVDLDSYFDKKADESVSSGSTELTDEQKEIIKSVDFTGEIGAKILNTKLNDTILDLLKTELGSSTIEAMINNLLVTECDLTTALEDLWSRLLDSPVATIVEILPVLTVVIDELLMPFLLNSEEDPNSGLIYNVLSPSLLAELTGTAGSNIGITQLGWDLNELLPDVLHWLQEGSDYKGVDYYDLGRVRVQAKNENGDLAPKLVNAADVDTADVRNYEVVDTNGNKLTRVDIDDETAEFTYMGKTDTDLKALLADYPNVQFEYYMNYESDVPVLTGIYIADHALRDISISDIGTLVTDSLNAGIDKDNLTSEEIKEQEETNATTGKVVEEIVTEIASFFTEAVDIYVNTPAYRDQPKYDVTGREVSSGLNNIFVAIPQLFDIAENLFADKYGIDEDAWVYCYEGKIGTNKVNSVVNNSLEEFKAFAGSDDPNRKVDIFDKFAEIFVENWLNAIVSLVNNLVSTDNKITEQLPTVTGLLNSLGGLGEKSIFTDLFNSIFQLTRDDKFSFTFDDENFNENNKFTGLSKDNAYFLITNISRLVEVITNLINSFSTSTTSLSETPTEKAVTFSTAKSTSAKAVTTKSSAAGKATQDLSNATDLINNLDKMLSSLLADATLNDFALNKTDNILSGLVTMLSNYLGEDFSKNEDDIVRLLDSYLYYITGSGTLKAGSDKNVDAKKVYTNDSLTGLVVETYSLVEKIASSLTSQFSATYQLDDGTTTNYNLLAEAVSGIISPDVISIRLEGDYNSAAKTIAKYNSWTNMTAETSRGDYKVSIDWNIKAGDKDAFFDGLAASLRVLTSVIGVLLIDSGLYDTLVNPVLGAICTPNGIKLTSYETLVADKEKTGYYDETLIAIITPVSDFINLFLSKPATTLVKTVQGLAGILDDKNSVTLASIINGALTTVTDEINGVANIVDSGISNLTPTGAKLIREFTQSLEAYGKTDKNNALVNIKIGNIPLSGANLIPIINTIIADTGITLSNINWNKLSTASTPAAALIYFLEYVLDNLPSILNVIKDSETRDMILKVLSSFSTEDLLGLINQILEASDSPTMAYWIFAQYLQEVATGFKYPAGITAAMANEGVESLDQIVEGIFPLLSSFGVDLGDSLQGVLDNKLFTNSILTQLATKLYGALDGLDPTIKTVLNGLGIVTSTKDVAKLLTDKSYGATYSSAAKAISAQSSWSKVKNVNWGFKDGSSNAQQGFVNALVAILRPLNDVLAVFLNEGTLHIDESAYEIICGLSISSTTTSFEFNIGDVKFEPKITYSMKNGVLTLTVKDANAKDSQTSTLKIDFKSIKEANDLKLEGTNGYNSAIIPFLEALKCSNVKTYAQYQKDVAKAKDNLLLDVLNPIAGATSTSLVSKLADAPVSTLADILPNVGMYLKADGAVQLVTNLLAPITYGLNNGDNSYKKIGSIVEELLGAPLEDMIIPLVNQLLADKDIPIELPDIDWAFLASLGDAKTYKSKSVDLNGKYITGKTVDADQGKVLVTFLRYVAEVLINNSTELKNLICSIDKVKNSDILSSILRSVFNTIGTAGKDELVCAVFYLLSSRPTNAFWDYTKYETGSYTFTYPEGVDVDFLKNLPPMLDGLIGGLLDLNGLVEENLFKDSIISSLATGLYGAVEGVKINDDLNLAQLLAQTDIDFTTDNVAKLLVDEDYGQTYESAASVIKAAGSWKNVNADSLKWGVTDRDSFFHALVAVLRPLYGVLDVLLNDAYLGLFDIVRIPGSNGYSSSIVPLMEAFSMYNIKTQYQYRQDMQEEYDAILLDIINPLWDLVEDVLNAPIQTIAKIVPNLALFIGNDGLCQIIENLFTPISALADAIRPIVDLNSLLTTVLDALDVDLNSILGKVGVTNFSLDLYDLKETLKPLLGADSLIPLINNILPMIKIGGSPLGLKLNPVDWLQLASHGTTVVSASQAATFGSRIYVEGDSSETLIAVLKYLIITINTGENYDVISNLIGGLIGGADSNMSGTISQVLTVIKGDTDTVIASLVELLQTIA